MTQSLQRISVREPGVEGLNLEGAFASHDTSFALTLDNAVFDETGRVAARQGWTEFGTSHGQLPISIALFVDEGGLPALIHSTSTHIYESSAFAFAGFTDRTGTASGGDWQFTNYLTRMVGARHNQTLIERVAGTNFAPIVPTAGTVPDGDCVLAAFGRLWATTNDRKTIKFSVGASHTDWASAGSGSINTRDLIKGTDDQVVGLAEFQGRFVIFMERNIVIYVNPEDPADPAFQVEDIIENVGAQFGTRDCITNIGNDILFVSSDGVRSLSRAIEANDRLPMTELTPHVKGQLTDDISAAQNNATYPYSKATYSRKHGLFFLQLATNYWMFDLKRPAKDGTLRTSRWFGLDTYSCYEDRFDRFILGVSGGLAFYGGYLDGTESYRFKYQSTHGELFDGRGFIPKSIVVTTFAGTEYTATLSTEFDFTSRTNTYQFVTGAGSGSEWNVAEWGLGEWSGGTSLVKRTKVDVGGEGERMCVGIEVTINGAEFSFQSIDVMGKLGRLAA